MILFKSVRMHLFVILDYLVHRIKQQKPEDTVSWKFQLAWHSDLIQLACPCDGKNSKSQWLCQSWVVRRGKASSLNNYCTLYFSMHFHLNQTFLFPMPLSRNLSASFWSKAGDTSFESLHLSWHQEPWLRGWAVLQSWPAADAHSVPSISLST